MSGCQPVRGPRRPGIRFIVAITAVGVIASVATLARGRRAPATEPAPVD